MADLMDYDALFAKIANVAAVTNAIELAQTTASTGFEALIAALIAGLDTSDPFEIQAVADIHTYDLSMQTSIDQLKSGFVTACMEQILR
jgi:hypothetical protein